MELKHTLTVYSFAEDRVVELLWISGHIDLSGNEIANNLAKSTARQPIMGFEAVVE